MDTENSDFRTWGRFGGKGLAVKVNGDRGGLMQVLTAPSCVEVDDNESVFLSSSSASCSLRERMCFIGAIVVERSDAATNAN